MTSKILVAIDFGTTYSGFAYVHKESPENVVVNNSWPGREGVLKAPTALQYDENYKKVISWGNLALEEEPDEDDDPGEKRSRPIELFKLHLSNLNKKDKPWLPPQFNYKKAIEDYLSQMRILIKETLEKRWPTVRFPHQIEFVFTIPAEWPPHTTKIMRECAYKAGLLTHLNSNQLEFTTEPEAAALHCLKVIKEHKLQPGESFLVADCGGGTIDLTSRKLLPENKLSEITERVGDLCGSTFVDKEFLQWLGRRVGFQAIEKLKLKNYGQMQHLVKRFFCSRIKFKFTGEETEYKALRLNLQQYCPDLPQYVIGETREKMDDVGWVLKIDFRAVKEMFDPVIDRIIKLISDQLKSSENKCSAIFLVGGFSESPYLFHRVKEMFKYEVRIIAVPALPIAAIVRGAITYGLNIMTNERSKRDSSENLTPDEPCDSSENLTPDEPCDSSENLASDEPHEIVERLGFEFNEINNRLTNLLEENQRLKQQYKNLQEEHQETLHVNSELREELQEKDKKFEDFQQYVLNLEKQKNDEIQELKIITRNLEKNLEIFELVEISEDDHQ